LFFLDPPHNKVVNLSQKVLTKNCERQKKRKHQEFSLQTCENFNRHIN
jgi:hypothetical protein